MKNLAVIQVDDNIRQLPQSEESLGLAPSKLATRNLAGKTVVEWLARRISEAQQVGGVVVVIPDESKYDAVCNVVPSDIPCFRSRKETPLERLVDVAEEYYAESIVRIPVDNPLCDAELLDCLLIHAQREPQHDFVGYQVNQDSRTQPANLGLFAEWIAVDALRRAMAECKSELDRYHVSNALVKYPGVFSLKMLPMPKGLDRDDIRFCVLDEEDWDQLLSLWEALRTDDPHWQDVLGMTIRRPEICRRMAQRNASNSQATT